MSDAVSYRRHRPPLERAPWRRGRKGDGGEREERDRVPGMREGSGGTDLGRHTRRTADSGQRRDRKGRHSGTVLELSSGTGPEVSRAPRNAVHTVGTRKAADGRNGWCLLELASLALPPIPIGLARRSGSARPPCAPHPASGAAKNCPNVPLRAPVAAPASMNVVALPSLRGTHYPGRPSSRCSDDVASFQAHPLSRLGPAIVSLIRISHS